MEATENDGKEVSPRADFVVSLVWIALGLGIAWISWNMDRLSHLQASIYTAPGLVPGILGLSIAFMGALLLLRALRAGPRVITTKLPFHWRTHWRLIFSLSTSLLYAFALVFIHGPFWLVTALYVGLFVFVFQYEQRVAAQQLRRGFAVAVVHGLITGLVIQYVFEELFLVRLP
jgi:hypothetical protein